MSTTKRFWGLATVCFAAFFMGGVSVAVFFEFNLFQGGLCAGLTSVEPWACGRQWAGALSGWAAAIAAIGAALYAGSLVKIQIERTEDQIDKTVEANSIARIGFASEALDFIETDLTTITPFLNKRIAKRHFERSVEQKRIAIHENTLKDLIRSVDHMHTYMLKKRGTSIKLLPPSCYELREKLLLEFSAFGYNSAEIDKHVQMIINALKNDIENNIRPFDELQISRTLEAFEKYHEATANWKEKLRAMQAIAFGHD